MHLVIVIAKPRRRRRAPEAVFSATQCGSRRERPGILQGNHLDDAMFSWRLGDRLASGFRTISTQVGRTEADASSQLASVLADRGRAFRSALGCGTAALMRVTDQACRSIGVRRGVAVTSHSRRTALSPRRANEQSATQRRAQQPKMRQYEEGESR